MEYSAEEQRHRDKLIQEIEEMRVVLEGKPDLKVIQGEG
jgi:hypothetical protein